MKKKLLLLVVMLLGLFVNVKADMPETTRVNGATKLDYVIASPSPESSWRVYAYVKTVSDGGYIYCIEPKKDTLQVGHYLSFGGEITDPGYQYLGRYGFPNSKPLPEMDDNQNYYITQMAHWMYAFKLDSTNRNGNQIVGVIIDEDGNLLDKYNKDDATADAIVKAAYKLYQDAYSAHQRGYVVENLNITATSPSSKMVKSNNELITDLVTVNLAGADNYTVSTNNTSATIVDANGNSKNTFAKGEKFRVKMPFSSSANVEVTISASNTTDKVYRYKPEMSNLQDVLYSVLETTQNNKTSKISFMYQENKKTVEISKVDVTTGQELPGAHIVLKNSVGAVVEEWDSTSETHKVTLEPGNYTLTETIAPNGYLLSSETVEFTVNENGTTSKIVMENVPIGDTVISKIDVTTGKELPGAHLEIRDKNDTLVADWVSEETPHTLKLNPGEYTLTETISPNGYIISKEEVKFTVNEDGTSSKIIMKNRPYGETIISKVDAGGGQELAGAYLEIHNSAGELVESWISKTTPHRVKLAPGEYTLTETQAPEGYVLSKETISFKVDDDGTSYNVVMKNEVQVPMTSLNRNTIILITSIVAGIAGVGVLAFVGHRKKKVLA